MVGQLILGVDPGVASMGVALVWCGGSGRPEVERMDVLGTLPGEPLGERLASLADRLREVASGDVSAVAIEDQRGVFLGRSREAETSAAALDVQAAMGVACGVAAHVRSRVAHPVPVLLISPQTAKRALGCSGRAGKAEIRAAVSRLVLLRGALDLPRISEHAADAIAVALAAAPRLRLEAAVSAAGGHR